MQADADNRRTLLNDVSESSDQMKIQQRSDTDKEWDWGFMM